MKHGKKYNDSLKKLAAANTAANGGNESAAPVVYDVNKACEMVKEFHYTKFDETVDLSVKVNLKKSQTVRDTMVLPNQFKAEKRILVFCKAEKEAEAKEAGAAYIGAQDLIDKIKGGWLDFDIAVATPDMMKDVGKLGMILGRRGLMPNPKTGTVTFDLKSAIAELRRGRVEFRADKTGVVHVSIGKVSMDTPKLAENVKVALAEINRKRPADAKGAFVQSVSISSTMGPGVWVDAKEGAA
jgi:large subunit ribosomal protein L1